MQQVLSEKLQRFAALRPGEEAIRYSLYHHKNLAAGALNANYQFFNVPVGAQDPDTGAAASQEDTNMNQAGILSAPNRMFVTVMNVPITAPTTDLIPVGSADDGATESLADDIARLTLRGLFLFKLLNKEYLRLSPLAMLGAGYGVYGALSAATTNAATTITNAIVNNGMPTRTEGFAVALPLETQTSFEASIGFPKATLTTANDLRVGVVLRGVLYRPEQ